MVFLWNLWFFYILDHVFNYAKQHMVISISTEHSLKHTCIVSIHNHVAHYVHYCSKVWDPCGFSLKVISRFIQ